MVATQTMSLSKALAPTSNMSCAQGAQATDSREVGVTWASVGRLGSGLSGRRGPHGTCNPDGLRGPCGRRGASVGQCGACLAHVHGPLVALARASRDFAIMATCPLRTEPASAASHRRLQRSCVRRWRFVRHELCQLNDARPAQAAPRSSCASSSPHCDGWCALPRTNVDSDNGYAVVNGASDTNCALLWRVAATALAVKPCGHLTPTGPCAARVWTSRAPAMS